MTLARTRLLLGITAVGATVLIAGLALWRDLPGDWLSADATDPVLSSVLTALVWPLIWTVLLLPLDLVGGTMAVRHSTPLPTWIGRWLRGVGTQMVVLAVVGVVLVSLSRALGLFGAITGTTVAAALIASQAGALARLGAFTRALPSNEIAIHAAGLRELPVEVVETHDEAFVGGFTGLVRPRLIVPSAWFTLPRETLHGLLVRRRLAAGAPRVRGIGLALAWLAFGATASGFAVALPDSAAGLVRFSLAMTLWSFLGVLVLPTPSRRAVVALDQQATRVVGPGVVRDGITALERWQDDEPARAPFVEMIFHPVPARDARLAVLTAATPTASGAWRVARLALPLGLGGWSLLGRAVHCNLGRPALWWILPGD